MIHNIFDMYGLGAIPIQRLFEAMVEPPRKIIDVEYEDLSDQINIDNTALTVSKPKLLETNKQKKYVDSDNQPMP